MERAMEKLRAEMARPGRSAGIVCAKCGSMYVDPRSLHELACADCGQTAAWDGTKFLAVRQGSEETDVRNSLQRAAYRRTHQRCGDVSGQIVRAVDAPNGKELR